jgi:hypothetical protein
MVHRAVQSGKLIKPTECSKCYATPKRRWIQAHHPDYTKPLEVVWLCRDCHYAEHDGWWLKRKRDSSGHYYPIG